MCLASHDYHRLLHYVFFFRFEIFQMEIYCLGGQESAFLATMAGSELGKTFSGDFNRCKVHVRKIIDNSNWFECFVIITWLDLETWEKLVL